MDPFSEPISKLSDAVISVIQTTADFKPQLAQLKNTLDRIAPIIVDIQNHNRKLDAGHVHSFKRRKLDATKLEQEMFVHEIQEAEKLVYKCLKIKWNLIKRFTHSLRLKDVNQKLLRFFQIEVQAVQCRDIKTTLEEVNHVGERITSLALDVRHLGQALDSGTSDNRKKLGWPVPPVPRGIVGFDEPLKNLKAKILSDINIQDDGSSMDSDVCKVVVVSAAGGSGKTTLVKMLGNDSQIQDNFQGNVFFVTVSETPDFIASVNDLFNPNRFDRQVKFQGIEDAKNKLENFFREKVSGPILVVLDDVWDESYIENFEFDIKGYNLLVTSRMIFPKYDVFKFDPLSDKHAKILFRNSARPEPTIDENLVDQMVKCCKNHPLTLSVVGGSLNGKNEVAWKFMLKSLSQGHSVLDLNQDLNKKVLDRLERSFEALEDEFKQCFLDFGLFLEDQSIPANALLDMWVHLYNHDDEGVDTLAKIYELSYRNLVDFEIFREEGIATVNYCTRQFVTQHDLLRQLAIILSSKLPVAKRRRLFISEQNGLLVTNVQGKHQMALVEETQEPMQARILSISTGESFSSRWCNIRVPEVEVLVLNLRSHTYTLPSFLKDMQKLKILNVTNYSSYRTKLEDFHLLSCFSNLTRIRLERVEISSFSRSTLELVNLQKISFIWCNMQNAFKGLSIDNLNVWPRLVEIEIHGCHGLRLYPQILCSNVYLKKLSITFCLNLCEISEELGKLTSLETLILYGCIELKRLPESITKLQNLSILDISHCLKLTRLPEKMGSLGGLRKIYMTAVLGIDELPPSVKDLSNTKVICNKGVACLWKEFSNVETNVVELKDTAWLSSPPMKSLNYSRTF